MNLDLNSKSNVFRCPQCGNFINDRMEKCSYCKTPVDRSRIGDAILKKKEEQRRYRRRHYGRHIPIGLAIFAAGLGVLCITLIFPVVLIGSGGFIILPYGAIVGGLGDFLYGFIGWLGELKR